MTTERAILDLLAQTYVELRDDHRALKCRQVSDSEALPMLREFLAEDVALIGMARLDLDEQIKMHGTIADLRRQLALWQDHHRLLLDHLRQLYPG